MILLAGFIVFSTISLHSLAFYHQNLDGGLDLGKNWQLSFKQEPKGTPIWESYTVQLPDTQQERYRSEVTNHIEYRNTFITPDFCSDPNQNGCVFYVGGIYQGSELFLNGLSLGYHFTKSDLYPAAYRLPKGILNPVGSLNEIRISVYTQEPKQHPGVVQGPIGIFNLKTSYSISQAIIGERVVLPIVAAAINLVLGLIALFWMLSKNSSRRILSSYILFCISSALYMLNATRIPREVLHYNPGMALNFGLRYLMDFSIFYLVITVFSLRSRWTRTFMRTYSVIIAVFFIFLLLTNFFPSFDLFLHTIYFRFNTVSGGIRNGGFLYLLACIFSPLMILGKVTGLHQSLRFYNKVPGAPVLLLMFTILVPMQVFDILTFLGFIRTNHEIYYLRLYTPFIGLAFGYSIWLMWIKKERITEATLRVGSIAEAVAHDLKSPVSTLKVLSNLCLKLDPTEREILTCAIDRIEATSSNLLASYRSSLQEHSQSFIEPFRSVPIQKVISEVIQSKNYALHHQGQTLIQFETNNLPQDNIKCRLMKVEFSRALDNVLNNAIDASYDVPTPAISVSLTLQKSFAEIEVSDNGKGADEHLLRTLNQQVFDSTTKTSGHGIGLRKTWEAVKAHQGSLHFERSRTGGMLVRITLPVEEV
jgi:signal transduction histidine kinase